MNAIALTTATDSFAAEFGTPLPRALRETASSLTWQAFTARYTSASGPIRLGSWTARPDRAGRTTYDATFGFGDTISSCSATAFGPIEALTDMLHEAGFRIEITSFHQQRAHTRTATFVECDFMGRRQWAMALDDNALDSSIRAIVTAANLLHS